MVKNRTYDEISSAIITYNGPKYAPVSHKLIVDAIRKEIANHGWTIYKEEFRANKGCQQLIGKFIIDYPETELKPMISFKNGLDGQIRFGVCSGTANFVCLNGIIFGNAYQHKRKHTGDAAEDDILESIKDACDSLPAMLAFHKQFANNLKACTVFREEMYDLCAKLFFRDEILNSEELNIIAKEFKLPTHDYGYSNTLWELYNYCTFALKDAHPIRWHKQHQKLSDFFNNILEFYEDYNDEEE